MWLIGERSAKFGKNLDYLKNVINSAALLDYITCVKTANVSDAV